MKKQNLFKKVSAGLLSLCVLAGSMNAVTPVAMADGEAETSYELPNKYPVGVTKADGTYNYGMWLNPNDISGNPIANHLGNEATQPLEEIGGFITEVHKAATGGGTNVFKDYWYTTGDGEDTDSHIRRHSNPEKQFKVDGKNFLLLDVDKDGNYFVLSDDMYGTHSIYAANGDRATESSNWFQGFLNGKWTYSATNTDSVGYWLNNGFLTNGNGEGNKLPNDIINNLVEKEWGVEGGSNLSDGYFWTNATGTKPESAYTNIPPYKETQKVSLLSAWEYRIYWKDISPWACNVKLSQSWEDKSTQWLLRTPKNKPLTDADSSGNGIIVYAQRGDLQGTNVYNAYGIRPCFFLNKDFFEKVKISYDEENKPNYVLNEIKKVSFDKLVALYGQEKAVELKGNAVDSTVTLQNVYIKGQAIAGNTVSAHVIAPLGVDSVAYSWLHSDTKDGTYSVVATGDTLTLENTHKGYMKLMAIAEKDGKYSTPKETQPFEVTALEGFDGTEKTYTSAVKDNPTQYTFSVKTTASNCVWKDWLVLDKVYGSDGKPQLFIFTANAPMNANWEHSATGADSTEKNNNSSQKFDSRITDIWEKGNHSSKVENHFDTQMLSYAKKHNWLTEAGNAEVVPNDYIETTTLAPLSKWEYEKYINKIGINTINASGGVNNDGFTMRTPKTSVKNEVTRMCVNSNGAGRLLNRAGLASWNIGLRLGMYIDMDYFKNGYLDTENTASTSEICDLMKKHFTREELAGSYTLNGSESEINAIGAISEDNAPQATNVAVKSLRIDGDLIVGGNVKAEYTFVGDTDGDTESGTTYQWYAMGASGVYEKIDGATDKEYTLTTKEMGREILVEVIPSNGTVNGVAATAMTDSVVKTEVFNTELNANVSISGGKLTAALAVQSADDVNCMAIVAFYGDGDKLVDIKVQDISLAEGYNPDVTVEHTFDSTARTYKVMLWEKTTNRPIVQGKGGSITQ